MKMPELLVAHMKVLEAQCAHQQSFMKQSFERGILLDQQREKLQQAYVDMGQRHADQIRHLYDMASDLSSDIDLRTL